MNYQLLRLLLSLDRLFVAICIGKNALRRGQTLRSNVVFNSSSDCCGVVGACVAVEGFNVIVLGHILRLLIERFKIDGIKLSALSSFFLFIIGNLATLGDFATLIGHLSLLTTVDVCDIVGTLISRERAINWSILVQNT